MNASHCAGGRGLTFFAPSLIKPGSETCNASGTGAWSAASGASILVILLSEDDVISGLAIGVGIYEYYSLCPCLL